MMISLNEFVSLGFETKVFPKELCDIQNVRETNVKDCKTFFTCVVFEDFERQTFRIINLKPYICNMNSFDNETLKECYQPDAENYLYGWTDQWGNIYNHFEHKIHTDNSFVIAWRVSKK